MSNYDQYTWFKTKREQLAGLLGESSKVVDEMNMRLVSETLAGLGRKVNNDSFRLMVTGTFKNGKSAFINAILGEYVLPSYSVPCTAVISEVKYGEEKRVVLHFQNPLPDRIAGTLPEATLRYMESHGMKDIPPLEIPYDELESYVTIPVGEDSEESILESPFEKAEVFYPCPILKEGVEIIDSPGLNEHTTRTKVTMEYLSKADAILFVLNATAACAQTEISFLENDLAALGFEDPFIIVNKIDMVPERERAMLHRYIDPKVRPYTKHKVFYTSAIKALDGKEKHDNALLAESGFIEFEEALQSYLTTQKGKAKLTAPARELNRILTAEVLEKAIPTQRSMLGQSLGEARMRYNAARPKLDEIRNRKATVMQRMELRIEQSRNEFRRAVKAHISEIIQSVPVWIEQARTKSKFSAIPTKSQGKAVISELLSIVTEKIQENHIEWQKEVLEPLISDRASIIFDSAEPDIQSILQDIDRVSFDVAGLEDTEPSKVKTWERLSSVGVGLLIGDLSLAISGGVNGFSKELVKTLAFNLGAGFLLGFFGIFNPFTVIPVLLGSVIWNLIKGADNAMKNVKQKVTERIVDDMVNTSEGQAEETANKIAEKLREIASGIATALDREVGQTEEQLQAILDEINRGQQAVDQRKAALDDVEHRTHNLNKRLNDLIFELAEI
ncbi:MAG: dynamin family protein [Clostridium sp.]|nr:dynamin family protein [Clostridium sp.]